MDGATNLEIARLAPEAMESFHERGFLVVQRITSDNDVAAIRSVIDKLVATRAGYQEGAFFDALGAGEEDQPRFTQIVNAYVYARELLASEFVCNAATLACELLGPEARFINDLVFVKPARTGDATPWHQDEAYRDPNFDRHCVTFWLPLQPVDRANGCLEFIPGSHRWRVLDHRPVGGDSRVSALECCEPFDASHAVACPIPLGGASLHAANVMHYAHPNLSDAPRCVYSVRFEIPPTPVSVPRQFPWQDQRDTDRSARLRRWRWRGGFVVEIWRDFRRARLSGPIQLSDYANRFFKRRLKRR